ncbi:MAG: divergent polysaccharide deacetylase family protein [Pseudomonadota bacterium]
MAGWSWVERGPYVALAGFLLMVGAAVAWLVVESPGQEAVPEAKAPIAPAASVPLPAGTVAEASLDPPPSTLEIGTDDQTGADEDASAPNDLDAPDPAPLQNEIAPDRPEDPPPALADAAGSQSDREPEATTGGSQPDPTDSRPFRRFAVNSVSESDERPRIAIVIHGLGLSKKRTDNAFASLPSAVTFAFSPYAEDLPSQVADARANGHEVVLMVPMEPVRYPANDPGPHTLLVSNSEAENLRRIEWVFGRTDGYVGVMNDMGSRFTAISETMRFALREVKARGLMYLDARSTAQSKGAQLAREANIPWALNNRYIDTEPTPDEIDRMLRDLENTARTFGAAVGLGRPLPITIARVEAWAKTLEAKDMVLVPLTAVAERQPVR